MSRACSICTHNDHAEIDAALARGTPNRRIAAQLGVSENALRRHKSEHLPRSLTRAREASEVARADELLGEVRTLHSKALDILASAEKQGDSRTALSAIREARSCLELLARLLGELEDGPTVSVLVNPEWITIRSEIELALRPWPKARSAVAQALRSGDAGD